MTRPGFIYWLRFPNDKGYVGLTTGSVAKRLTRHRYDAKRERPHCYLLARAWRKYGEPECIVMGTYPAAELPLREIELIAALDTLTPGGYNVSPGGAIVSAETIEKRRVALAAWVIANPDKIATRTQKSAKALRAKHARGEFNYRPINFTPAVRAKMAASQRANAARRTNAKG